MVDYLGLRHYAADTAEKTPKSKHSNRLPPKPYRSASTSPASPPHPNHRSCRPSTNSATTNPPANPPTATAPNTATASTGALRLPELPDRDPRSRRYRPPHQD